MNTNTNRTFASRFRKVRFDLNTDGFTYASLSDLFNQYGKNAVYPFYALYINRRSRFGEAPVVATRNEFVNLPKHLLDDCQQMLSDPEILEAINRGECGFRIYQYTDARYNRVCFGVEWVDIPDPVPASEIV